MTENVNKVPLIFFSGGLDSTFLLIECLRTHDCEIVTVESNILPPDGMKSQAVAIDAILEKVKKLKQQNLITGSVLNRCIVEWDYPHNVNTDNFKLSQIPIWFNTALWYVNRNKHNAVSLGYVINDDACYYLPHLTKAWKSMWKSCMHGELVPMKFPLLEQGYSKKSIIEIMSEEPLYEGILSMISYCEFPEFIDDKWIPCGQCHCCYSMTLALNQPIAIETQESENVFPKDKIEENVFDAWLNKTSNTLKQFCKDLIADNKPTK